jgi:hypothetical protein
VVPFHWNANGNANFYPNCHYTSVSHANSYSYSYRATESYTNGHRYGYRQSKIHSGSAAPPDASAAPESVMGNATLL